MKTNSNKFMIFGIEEILINVGKNIKIARIRRNITIKELANRSHLNERTISRLEKGDPSINFKNLVTVLITLGISDSVLNLANPNDDDLGKALEFQKNPQRVRNADKLKDDF